MNDHQPASPVTGDGVDEQWRPQIGELVVPGVLDDTEQRGVVTGLDSERFGADLGVQVQWPNDSDPEWHPRWALRPVGGVDEQLTEPAAGVREQLDHAVRIREATPGMPADGPYPASVGDVADEVVAWIEEMDRTYASGLVCQVFAGLHDAIAAADSWGFFEEDAPAVPAEPPARERKLSPEFEAITTGSPEEVARWIAAPMPTDSHDSDCESEWETETNSGSPCWCGNRAADKAFDRAAGSSETTPAPTPSEVQATPSLGDEPGCQCCESPWKVGDRVELSGWTKPFPQGVVVKPLFEGEVLVRVDGWDPDHKWIKPRFLRLAPVETTSGEEQ